VRCHAWFGRAKRARSSAATRSLVSSREPPAVGTFARGSHAPKCKSSTSPCLEPQEAALGGGAGRCGEGSGVAFKLANLAGYSKVLAASDTRLHIDLNSVDLNKSMKIPSI
jgi:hypothetical protein